MELQRRPRRKKKNVRVIRKQLPEPFLWYLFESLALACVAMNGCYGTQGMLHGDLHPGNVFFDEPDPTRCPLYPVPKVADFGTARRINNGVQNRTAASGIQGDPVYLEFAAPELSWDIQAANFTWEVPNMQITQRTNIYQIGLIMASAMRILNIIPENDWRRPNDPVAYAAKGPPPAQQLHHNANAGIGVRELAAARLNPGPKRYSIALVTLVQNCLRHAPGNRTTATNLLAAIRTQANFQGMDAPLAAGVTAARPPANLKKHTIHLKPDRWAVGNIF